MATRKESRTIGYVLISIGIILLFVNIAGIGWHHLWPIVFILGGLGFIALYLQDKKNYGVLMPASIFIVMGILFAVCAWQGWENMGLLWPLFIAAPGIGFFAMYIFGPHEAGLLIPAFILTGIAAVFLLAGYDRGEWWPVILILVGLGMILRRKTIPPA